jgi:hypothetical protein
MQASSFSAHTGFPQPFLSELRRRRLRGRAARRNSLLVGTADALYWCVSGNGDSLVVPATWGGMLGNRDMWLRIDSLSTDELRAALSVDLNELPEEEAFAIRDFVDRIGGIENAYLAIELLEELEEAA